MFHVILYQPEIPPNTGNIIRLCANTGCSLHLIEPLGFALDRRSVRRAGLDYSELASVKVYKSLADCLQQLGTKPLFAVETQGERDYCEPEFQPGDAFLFGAETRGLPAAVMQQVGSAQRLRIPMRPDNRSLNLANAVALVVYEAWRQNGFHGGQKPASQIRV